MDLWEAFPFVDIEDLHVVLWDDAVSLGAGQPWGLWDVSVPQAVSEIHLCDECMMEILLSSYIFISQLCDTQLRGCSLGATRCI